MPRWMTSYVLHLGVKVTAVSNSLSISPFHHQPVSNTALSGGHTLSFFCPLPSLSIEKLNDRHTSDWQGGGENGFGKTAGWMLSARSAFCSVLLVLVISLTVDLVEIAACPLEPRRSGSQQTASHPALNGHYIKCCRYSTDRSLQGPEIRAFRRSALICIRVRNEERAAASLCCDTTRQGAASRRIDLNLRRYFSSLLCKSDAVRAVF